MQNQNCSCSAFLTVKHSASVRLSRFHGDYMKRHSESACGPTSESFSRCRSKTVWSWLPDFLFCGLLLWQDFPSMQEVTGRPKWCVLFWVLVHEVWVEHSAASFWQFALHRELQVCNLGRHGEELQQLGDSCWPHGEFAPLWGGSALFFVPNGFVSTLALSVIGVVCWCRVASMLFADTFIRWYYFGVSKEQMCCAGLSFLSHSSAGRVRSSRAAWPQLVATENRLGLPEPKAETKPCLLSNLSSAGWLGSNSLAPRLIIFPEMVQLWKEVSSVTTDTF